MSQLKNLINDIKREGYDFIYIDDSGTYGTTRFDINMIKKSTTFTEGNKRLYYYIENGNKKYLTTEKTLMPRQAEELFSKLNLNETVLKSEVVLFMQVSYKPPIFESNKDMIILYLVKDDIIAGYILSYSKYDLLGEYDIFIDNVEVNKIFRRQGLCKLIIKLFLLNVNSMYKKNCLTYFLMEVV